MKINRNLIVASLLAATTLLAPSALLAQQRQAIGQVTVISRPGSYVLASDIRLNASRDVAITIASDGVTLDLNGYQITGPGGKVGTGVLIEGVKGVKVTNGAIAYMAFGVIVRDSQNVVVSDLQIRGMGLPILELPPETGVMVAQSRNVVVEDNAIYNTGLGVFVRGGMSWGNRIAGNTITAGTNGALGICYNPTDSDPMAPRGDVIENNLVTGFGLGLQMKSGAFNNVIRDNVIAYRDQAMDLQNDSHITVDNQTTQLP